MIKFSVFGFEIAVTFGFLFIISLTALLNSPALAFLALASCVIHELGHRLAAVILNVKMSRITFWSGGIQMRRECRLISAGDEAVILLCGPLFNFIFAAGYAVCDMNSAFGINLILGLFNLLPFGSLDGGSIIRVVLGGYGKLCGIVLKLAAVLTGVLLIIYFYSAGTYNITAYVTVLLLVTNEIFSSEF